MSKFMPDNRYVVSMFYDGDPSKGSTSWGSYTAPNHDAAAQQYADKGGPFFSKSMEKVGHVLVVVTDMTTGIGYHTRIFKVTKAPPQPVYTIEAGF